MREIIPGEIKPSMASIVAARFEKKSGGGGMRKLGLCLHAAILSGAFALAACGPSQPGAPTQPIVTDQARLARYEQCLGYYNNKQLDVLKDCYDKSATSEQFGYGKNGIVSGADAVIDSLQQFARSAPDVHRDAQLILANGPHVASIQLLTGTNSAPWTDENGKQTPATNKSFSVYFANAVEFAADTVKVINERGVTDSATITSQLGLSKAPHGRAVTPGAGSPEIVMAKNDATEKANLAAQTAMGAAWNRHDSAGVEALIADDAVFHDMTSGDHGKKEGAEMNAGDWSSFSNSRIAVRTMWAAGDYVVSIGAFEGTNDGAMPIVGMMKPSGRKLSIPVLEIDRYSDGKLKENWLFFDSAQFPTQLGLPAK